MIEKRASFLIIFNRRNEFPKTGFVVVSLVNSNPENKRIANVKNVFKSAIVTLNMKMRDF